MYNNYYYRGYSSADSGTAIAILLIALALSLLYFIAWCRLFIKAGLPWERMFVPIYGSYWMYQIAECGGFFWLTIGLSVLYGFLTPMLGFRALPVLSLIYLVILLIIVIIYCRRLARAFGKGVGFTIGLILLHPLFIMILGYGSAEYQLGSSAGKTVTDTWTCSCGTINPAYKGSCENCGAQRR